MLSAAIAMYIILYRMYVCSVGDGENFTIMFSSTKNY